MKTKKLFSGCYLYNGFYISVYRGDVESIWNIYTDKDLLNEYAIGFRTKKEAITFLKLKK